MNTQLPKMVKAITVWQPWASLLAAGIKTYETRSWPTKHRGPIAIHAAVKKDGWRFLDHNLLQEVMEWIGNIWPGACNKGKPELFGAVLATAELVACHLITSAFLATLTEKEIMLGDYAVGRYAWEIKNMQLLPDPIPAKGQQGLWNWQP